MNISLAELRSLSDNLATIPDDRPDWIKQMPYAMESSTHYYRLLWELVKQKRPACTIEVGVDKGGSTLTLAQANPAGKVVSIDIDRAACENARKIAEAHHLTNLTVVCDDSMRYIQSWDREKKIDLLFLDGAHDFEHCYGEYAAYRPFIAEGGIILFDDIHEGKQMDAAWSYIVDPKVELPKAHHSGFGACKVDRSIACPPLESILEQAKVRFK